MVAAILLPLDDWLQHCRGAAHCRRQAVDQSPRTRAYCCQLVPAPPAVAPAQLWRTPGLPAARSPPLEQLAPWLACFQPPTPRSPHQHKHPTCSSASLSRLSTSALHRPTPAASAPSATERANRASPCTGGWGGVRQSGNAVHCQSLGPSLIRDMKFVHNRPHKCPSAPPEQTGAAPAKAGRPTAARCCAGMRRRQRPARAVMLPCPAASDGAREVSCLEGLRLLQQLGRRHALRPQCAHRPQPLLGLPAAVRECQQQAQLRRAILFCHGLIQPGELVKSKIGRHQSGRPNPKCAGAGKLCQMN